MSDGLPPLSPTVASIFGEFLKRLEEQTLLDARAIEALREALEEQKLDPESLRAAIFPA